MCVNYEASESSLFLEVCVVQGRVLASARWQVSAGGCAELPWVPVPAQLARPGTLGELPVPLTLLALQEPGVNALVLHCDAPGALFEEQFCVPCSLAGCLQAVWRGYLLVFVGLVHS